MSAGKNMKPLFQSNHKLYRDNFPDMSERGCKDSRERHKKKLRDINAGKEAHLLSSCQNKSI